MPFTIPVIDPILQTIKELKYSLGRGPSISVVLGHHSQHWVAAAEDDGLELSSDGGGNPTIVDDPRPAGSGTSATVGALQNSSRQHEIS
jgi:hypothetical protein